VTAEERYRLALVRIANAQSGVWGRIAREALHPKQTPAVHGREHSHEH
jgi:hypothetical protein